MQAVKPLALFDPVLQDLEMNSSSDDQSMNIAHVKLISLDTFSFSVFYRAKLDTFEVQTESMALAFRLSLFSRSDLD
jgi:hypothetical protein